MSCQPAVAEESSILENAVVYDRYLARSDIWPSTNLISSSFFDFVIFDHEKDPAGNKSAEFKIILSKPSYIKTAMIVNNCRKYGARYYIGSSEMRVGFNQLDFTLKNQVVASNIVDGGFQSFDRPTHGDIVTFRRNGPNPYDGGSSYLGLNEIRLYETVNLLEEQ